MLNIKRYKKQNKWLGSAWTIVKVLIPILVVLAILNWFTTRQITIVIEPREDHTKEVEFYEVYGPFLDENYTPPTGALEVDDLQSFNVPEDIKEYVRLFASLTETPEPFSLGILLTENRSFNLYAKNVNVDGSADYGLWQINGIEEYDPIENTKRAAMIFNNKKKHLASMGVSNPTLGLLAESYNKGAAGALSLMVRPGDYASKVLVNAQMPLDDPFVNNPFAYVNKL